MLLYISGSFPDNQEGIAEGAKVLLDAMLEIVEKDKIVLLTTNTPIISEHIKQNISVNYRMMDNWKVTTGNIKKFYSILDEYDITAIHMEYPGDLYGKTFLASFLPWFIKHYNLKRNKKITFNVRLHEFTRARFLRKAAIVPILLFADSIYIPALRDRNAASKIGGKRVRPTTIGTNINTVSDELLPGKKKRISYFGSVYPGKGIERMLKLWRIISIEDTEKEYEFKIIGDLGTERDNHFAEYHKQVWRFIEQYGLTDKITVTGYISNEDVSKAIQETAVATLPYEDGLTLRRGSFLAYLAHGIPVVTSEGDSEAQELFREHEGVSMTKSDDEFVKSILRFANLSEEERRYIYDDNKRLSDNFRWDRIAERFLKDYEII